ncbi:MAG: porphobilinogen synthase [Balneolaceae bacterium]
MKPENKSIGRYPLVRGRRMRQSEGIRRMVREHRLSADDLIAPLFVMEGKNSAEPIDSMPGCYRYTLDRLRKEVESLIALGIPAVLIFAKVPEDKRDNSGIHALDREGLMHRTVRTLKAEFPELVVMTDVALDPYSSYGHDGIVEKGKIVNDRSVELLAKMAVTHAEAGADMVAPSDMMDGRIGAIREALEENGFVDTGIMSYSAKYASCFYGPFRDALDSAPGFGDKKTYQMDPANVAEAVHESQLDEHEGADILMVKPGMPYLDVIRAVREAVTVPVAAYQVSGEYAMIRAAAQQGWLDGDEAMMESLIAFRRAGASLIATYFAKEAAAWLKE